MLFPSGMLTKTTLMEEKSESEHNSPANPKPKIVVVVGATGSGKSRLAVGLSDHFPIEIINADSMQVYEGLDVLTNKIPVEDQKGVPHHLLGVVGAKVEFTSKDFHDLAIPIIDDILSRGRLPVIVGGTNYYIQALVSPFLLDDMKEDSDEPFCKCGNSSFPLSISPLSGLGCFCDEILIESGTADSNLQDEQACGESDSEFELLREIDPASANRIHPNNIRKVKQYLSLYATLGKLPSQLFQGKGSEKWGRVDDFRYNCCFLWVDASLPVIDRFVEERVDSMIEAGLLNEVINIFNPNADCTRGLRQAIGVREFEKFLKCFPCDDGERYHSEAQAEDNAIAQFDNLFLTTVQDEISNPKAKDILASGTHMHKILLAEAIDKMKSNTRKLVRRQKRRLNRLRTLFGWNLHYFDATEAISSKSAELWEKLVVQPCFETVKAFMEIDTLKELNRRDSDLVHRDLWTQYICQACGNRVLRGVHEWEQHLQGREHRKRVASLKKKASSFYIQEKA